MSRKKYQFSKEFVFGVATSAGQIEGAILEDGRKLSIWDAFSFIPGNIANGDMPTVACDSYHRYKEDVALLKEIGVSSYRFSTSWSRILPDGVGKVNQKGLDYYKKLVDLLLENGIMPNVTLYHWDLPYELERMGGWLNRDSIRWFSDYVKVVFEALGDRVPMFSTLNEPIATYAGYAKKGLAPGYGLEKYGKQAAHNLLTAHGAAVSAFRSYTFKNSKIGVVVDVWNHLPLDKTSKADIQKAENANENTYRFFLNPLFKGNYSEYILKQMQEEGTTPQMQEDDLALISQPLDWFGLNCYNKRYVSASDVVKKEVKQEGGNYLDDGKAYYPSAVYEVVKMLREEYRLSIPVYVSENGMGTTNEQRRGGMIEDWNRVKYCKGFLKEIARANEDGLDVRGYYLWSLLDNFEWSAGYSKKYGICEVDSKTLQRKMKRSALEYKKVIQNRGFDEEP